MFSPLYLKIFEKSPFLMKTPTQNFAHHTEVKKHPFGVKTPILATLPSFEFNTVCQQKGPLAGYENRKFPKPFQGLLGMLREPPSAQKFRPRLHRPACTADFKCYF